MIQVETHRPSAYEREKGKIMKFALDVYPERFSKAQSHEEVIADALELVTMADAGGFDIAFTAEHHTIELHIGPNPLLTLAHWAGHTERIRLGTAIVIAPYWNPVRLAGEAAMVDVISGGRLELGIGRGAYQYEFDRMLGGMEQTKGGDYLRELVPLIRQLWRGEVAHSGTHWSFPALTVVPRPLQASLPPLWVAARSESTMEFAVENGCNVLANPFHRPFEEVVDLKRKFDNAVAKYPDRAPVKFFLLRRTCVYKSDEDRRAAIKALQEYGTRFENLYKNLGGVHDGFPDPVSFEDVGNKSDYTEDALMENLILGTPSEVIAKLEKYHALGIDYFGYGASYGLPADVARRSMRSFIDDIMPAFEGSGSPSVSAGSRA